jgi:hypothetical protein
MCTLKNVEIPLRALDISLPNYLVYITDRCLALCYLRSGGVDLPKAA